MKFKAFLAVILVAATPGFAAEISIGPISGSGFSINPVTYSTINITGAATGATVNTVTVRIRGTAPYADFCTFQLRDSSGSIAYTFPTWYDEFSFDHTVSGISNFAGRPVNQAWQLWGQGSNTSGERVDQWYITVYYDEPLNPGVIITGPDAVEVDNMVTLHASITDMTGPFSYQWSLNGTPIIGANAAEYLIPAAQYSDAGTYTVSVTDGSTNTYNSPDFVLEVLPQGSLPLSSAVLTTLMFLIIAILGVGVLNYPQAGNKFSR